MLSRTIYLTLFVMVFMGLFGCKSRHEKEVERVRDYITRLGSSGVADYAEVKKLNDPLKTCRKAIYVANVYAFDRREPESGRWLETARADCQRTDIRVIAVENMVRADR